VVTGALVAGLGAWALWSPKRQAVPVKQVRHGTVEVTYQASALVVRRETVLRAPISGLVKAVAAEGERVPVGARVAWVLPGARPVDVDAAASLSPAQAAQLRDLLQQYDDVTLRLFEAAAAQQSAVGRGDGDAARQLQATVEELNRRQVALSEAISTLEAGGGSPVEVGTGAAVEVTAERAGIVSYRLDGLEDLHASDISQWDVAWFQALPASLPSTPRTRVESGQDLVKIVDNLSATLAFLLPEQALGYLKPGSVRLTLTDLGNQPLPVHLVRLSPVDGGQFLVVVEADSLPEVLVAVRRTGVMLQAGRYTGEIVPRSSLTIKDGQTGVWLLVDQRMVFVPVTVIGGNDSEVVVSGEISAGDSVVLSPPS
jgi:putative membrane fusion protein